MCSVVLCVSPIYICTHYEFQFYVHLSHLCTLLSTLSKFDGHLPRCPVMCFVLLSSLLSFHDYINPHFTSHRPSDLSLSSPLTPDAMHCVSQMPVVLIPIHFDRKPSLPSCQHAVVLRPFMTSDYMTGLPAVPGKDIPVEVRVNCNGGKSAVVAMATTCTSIR